MSRVQTLSAKAQASQTARLEPRYSAFVIALAAFTDALTKIHDFAVRLFRGKPLITFNYLDWDSKPWRAEVRGESFLIAPQLEPQNLRTVQSIEYLTWDRSQWQAKLKDGQFAHLRGRGGQGGQLAKVLNYIDWDDTPRQATIPEK